MRVCSALRGQEAESLNLEYKPSDPSNNPYLALGGIIAAGLDGVQRGIAPGSPTQVDPGSLSDDERAARDIRTYPATQSDTLDALEADDVLMEALGPMSTSYLAVKRSEYAAFAAEDTAFETRHHLDKF